MSAPEFSRSVRLDTIGTAPRAVAIEADDGERAALAVRFGLPEIAVLAADAMVRREGETVIAEGRIAARVVQSCVATGDPVPAAIDEPFALRFVPALEAGDEIELDAGDLDTIPYEGGAIDLGEAAAETLALALDPFPRSPNAEATLRAAGVLSEEEAETRRLADSPFAALKSLGSTDGRTS